MNDNTLIILGALALGGWYLMQQQKLAEQRAAAQLAAASRRSSGGGSEGALEKVGKGVDSLIDGIKSIF